MIRARLLTAAAAVALFAGSTVLAQEAPEAPATPAAPPTAVTPAAPATATAAPAPQASTPATGSTVVDALRANGQFTTLLAALDAAQLTETLRTSGAISIFAPTDAAFAALPEAERTRLMDPANVNDLRQLLLYHVIVADVNSSQIEGTKGGVETAARTQVQLDGTGDAIMVDEATVVQADIDASNGAVFAIDQVLSPVSAQAPASTTPAAPAAGEAQMDDAEAPVDETTAATTQTPAPAAETEATPPANTRVARQVPAPAPAQVAVPTPRSPTTGSAMTNAPSGEAAAATVQTASPPVDNPTDGQVDGEAEEDDDMAPPPQG